MKNSKYWTTTNCGYCNKEFPIRKKLLANSPNKLHYCNPECHSNNRNNIAQSALDEYYKKKGLDWEKAKVHKLENWNGYRRDVMSWSKHNMKRYLPELWEKYINDPDLTIEHLWAVTHGFWRGVPPQLMGHSDNLDVLPRKENCEEKNDKWIDELIPDILRSWSELSVDIIRYEKLRPPRISTKVMPDSKCGYCNGKYIEDRSKADVAEKYCTITCEKKDWDTEDNRNILYNEIKDSILSLDWEIPVDITDYIIEKYRGCTIGLSDIVKDIFNDIWVGEYNLPIANVRGSIERQLVASNKHYSFPQSYSGPFILECIECGKVTETKWRNTLLRFHGIVQKKGNKDHCKLCSIKKSNTGIARGGWTSRKNNLAKRYGDKLSEWM